MNVGEINAIIGGLDLGAIDPATGTEWVLETLDGLGAPGSTVEFFQRSRRSGAWSGEGYAAHRSFAFGGKVFAADATGLAAALDALAAACARTPHVLEIVQGSRSRFSTVKRSGEILTKQIAPHIAQWSIQVASDESRLVGAPLSGSTPLPSSSGGLTVPFTVPFTIDAVAATGQVSLTNPGNETGPVQLRIDGPCAGPVITHASSGMQLVFASSLALSAGEWLEVDMEAHTVLANGQASRAGWVTSRGWSGFEPGENTWSFTAAQFDPASKLTVFATPAWQ